jgi:hypothetical protein
MQKAVSEARARKDELSKGQRNLVATRDKRHEVLEAKRPELTKQELTLSVRVTIEPRFLFLLPDGEVHAFVI